MGEKNKKKLFTASSIGLMLSVVALIISYLSYRLSQKQYLDNDLPIFDYTINREDSSYRVESIDFFSKNNNIVLLDFSIRLPSQNSETLIFSRKNLWEIEKFEYELFTDISIYLDSIVKDYPKNDPFTIRNYPTLNQPLVITFNYLSKFEVKQIQCLYFLEFKFVKDYHIKIESLKYIGLCKDDLSDEQLTLLLDYFNKTAGWFSLYFVESSEMDAFINKQKFINSELLNSFCNCYKVFAFKRKVVVENKNVAALHNIEIDTVKYFHCPSPIQKLEDVERLKKEFYKLQRKASTKEAKSIKLRSERIQSYLDTSQFYFLRDSLRDVWNRTSRWESEDEVQYLYLNILNLKMELWNYYNKQILKKTLK